MIQDHGVSSILQNTNMDYIVVIPRCFESSPVLRVYFRLLPVTFILVAKYAIACPRLEKDAITISIVILLILAAPAAPATRKGGKASGPTGCEPFS